MSAKKSIIDMARGAIKERVDYEMGRAMDNILDANTNPVRTSLYIAGASDTGEVQAVEMVPEIPGQISMDGEEQEAPQILNIINYR